MNSKLKQYFTLVLLLIYLLSLQPIIFSYGEEDDVLDQSQTHYSYDNANINSYQRWAQSFIPSVAMVSRVKLFMSNIGSNDDIIVSIRKNLDDPDLTKILVSSSTINSTTKQWVEFDFDDIPVIPGDIYFIVCQQQGKKPIQWAASYDNLYLNGKAFSQQLNPISNWSAWEDDMPFPYSVDLCFKTYGKYHPPSQPSEPNGPNQLRINQIGQYTTSSEDLDGDPIRYGWDWDGDNIVDYWSNYYDPGKICLVNHSWNEKGNAEIKVKAEDIDGYQSKWSFSKSLAVPSEKLKIILHFKSVINNLTFNLFPIFHIMLSNAGLN